jgi:hypothetical protein
VKSAKADLEKQLGTLTSERDTLNGRLSAIQIDQGVVFRRYFPHRPRTPDTATHRIGRSGRDQPGPGDLAKTGKQVAALNL